MLIQVIIIDCLLTDYILWLHRNYTSIQWNLLVYCYNSEDYFLSFQLLRDLSKLSKIFGKKSKQKKQDSLWKLKPSKNDKYKYMLRFVQMFLGHDLGYVVIVITVTLHTVKLHKTKLIAIYIINEGEILLHAKTTRWTTSRILDNTPINKSYCSYLHRWEQSKGFLKKRIGKQENSFSRYGSKKCSIKKCSIQCPVLFFGIHQNSRVRHGFLFLLIISHKLWKD